MEKIDWVPWVATPTGSMIMASFMTGIPVMIEFQVFSRMGT